MDIVFDDLNKIKPNDYFPPQDYEFIQYELMHTTKQIQLKIELTYEIYSFACFTKEEFCTF